MKLGFSNEETLSTTGYTNYNITCDHMHGKWHLTLIPKSVQCLGEKEYSLRQ